MKSTVLLIEDDRNISASLSDYLTSEGYVVCVAENLAGARERLAAKPVLVILDWMMPDGTGLDFLREIRAQGNQTPVIMLSAKSELVDKVLGLESGADDYLTKPFEPRELLTRMRVRLRGGSTSPKPKIYLGFEIDPQTREARFRGGRLELTKLEFDLLRLLVEEPGRVFTREEILNKVWGYDNFPTTRTVDNHIVQLRQKTEAGLFETVRGIGYRIADAKR